MSYVAKEMFKAVCAECKRECEVPFKPSGARPVYCRECYAKRRQKPANTGIGYGFNDSNSKQGLWQHPRKEDKFSLTSEN